MTLEQTLADWRERASQARRVRAQDAAALIDEMADAVERAAAPFLTWIDEPEAALISGRSTAWYRARFTRWEAEGVARMTPRGHRRRQYLQVVVPRRVDPDAARAEGRRAAQA